jgi:hypothetical protein
MKEFDIPGVEKQIFAAGQLNQLRGSILSKALANAAKDIDADILRNEIKKYAPCEGLRALQGTRVRDEEVFAIPCLLRKTPTLIGYYRLLLGASKKSFYASKTGLGMFKTMEEKGRITKQAEVSIDDFCIQYNSSITLLIRGIYSSTLREDISELPLLTLGSQVHGSWSTAIGTKATKAVFEALKEVVKEAGCDFDEDDSRIATMNAAGRKVTVSLAADPDVVIREDMGSGKSMYIAAIEIKGGLDYANIHNRVGEAEKSHQKAKSDGADQCWTIISLGGADREKLRMESPTTNHWFDIEQIKLRSGEDWDDVVARLKSAMSI